MLVTVIIPYSKPDLIEATLEKLMHQTYPPECTEIIVVGIGSTKLANRWPIKALDTHLIYYPGEARNRGAAAATGEYFLFIDDDCEPASDWIEQNVRELSQPEVGAVGGQIAGKSRKFFAQCVDFSSFAFSQTNRCIQMPVCSASLAVKRHVYEATGGFSQGLRSGEDIDFCYRLIKMGYKTVYQPKVKVLHNHQRDTFSALLRYSYFYGRVKGLYVKSQHAGMTKHNSLLTTFSHPLVYMLMIIPIALGITASITRFNLREYPCVLLYAPFIFLAKVVYHLGIWQWIVHNQVDKI